MNASWTGTRKSFNFSFVKITNSYRIWFLLYDHWREGSLCKQREVVIHSPSYIHQEDSIAPVLEVSEWWPKIIKDCSTTNALLMSVIVLTMETQNWTVWLAQRFLSLHGWNFDSIILIISLPLAIFLWRRQHIERITSRKIGKMQFLWMKSSVIVSWWLSIFLLSTL